MSPIIFFILVLTYTAKAGLLPGLPRLPNLDDPLSTVKGAVDGAKTGVTGIIGTVPELITDSFGNVLDINNVPIVPRIPVPEMVRKEGYVCENHYATTDDGYILNIHRIPFGKNGNYNGKAVILQHGFLAASSDWVLLGPKHGLAYILADEGYDVWMPNSRGNLYSRNHTRFSPDNKEFWQFSWHEIGIHDNPTIIDFVLLKTGHSDVIHIGHSQGTTAFYVMTSERPEYNQKIKAHISLAPIAFMNHLFSPLVRLAAIGTLPLDVLMQLIGQYEFLPNSGFLNLLTDVVCSQGVGKVLCKNALFAIAGFSPKQMNASNIPLMMAHYPAGAATRQIVHYGQEINSGRFQRFDFGIYNHDVYRAGDSGDYDLTNIITPIYLIYGSNDWMAANVDVEKLFNRLTHSQHKEIYNIPNQTWNHLDFLFGNDAYELVYKKVLEILSRC